MYECLQSEAEALNIEVQERRMKKRIKGLYGDNVIWINKYIETTIEKACVLAEEIGHHHTSAGDILDQSNTSNKKQEVLARRWASERLIPLHNLVSAFKEGCSSRFEIAEFLNVTETFLEETLIYYRQKHGTCVKADDKHHLFLDPLAIYENIE